MDARTKQRRRTPQSAKELLRLLDKGQADFGKGSRRLAAFFLHNPKDTALLTSAEVAGRCGVHASSVVRLAQDLGFSGYRELQALLQKDLAASFADAKENGALATGAAQPKSQLRLRMLCESGASFNEAAQAAAATYCANHVSVDINVDCHLPHLVDPQKFAQLIEDASAATDGLILVAREHPAINAAIKTVVTRGIPVVCLTSDLPSSGRTAYVGCDQFTSGATAGWFCGQMLRNIDSGRILFVYSVPFRCQLDREQGFRQVLRSEFPNLVIDERVASHESVDIVYEAVRRDIAKHGPPSAVYNVSGANTGIGRALESEGLASRTVFVGHELNKNSRLLLEQGIMDMAIGHDFGSEIAMAVECITMSLQGQQPAKRLTQSHIFMRFNCAVD